MGAHVADRSSALQLFEEGAEGGGGGQMRSTDHRLLRLVMVVIAAAGIVGISLGVPQSGDRGRPLGTSHVFV